MGNGQQLPLTFAHGNAFGLEDFMPAASNRDARAWLERWPDDQKGPALVLHGPEGSGKSHLAAIWASRTGARRLTIAELDQALQLEPSGCYFLDPAPPIDDEVGLLRLYNRLKEEGGHLLLTSRVPVRSWHLALPDLRSRLAAAPAASIHAPDEELLGPLFLKLFHDRQLKVPAPVLSYLLHQMERSFTAARRLVEELDRLSLERQQPITVPLARVALRQIGDGETVPR